MAMRKTKSAVKVLPTRHRDPSQIQKGQPRQASPFGSTLPMNSELIPKPSALLNTLPPELQTLIFSFLDPVTSTCLGVTCKSFYKIHINLQGLRVPLSRSLGVLEGGPAHLKGLLYDWMPEDMRRFNVLTGRFMTRDAEKKMFVEMGKLGEDIVRGKQG